MKNDFDVEKAVREYLPDVIHLSLSTSHDNKPWTSEVHFAYDDDLNLYFLSRPSRRHSEEIAVNPQISGTIVKQHSVDQPPVGVYFEGVAEVLTNVKQDDPAYQVYDERLKLDWPWIESEAKLPDGHRFYKINVSDYYVFDAGKHHLIWKT